MDVETILESLGVKISGRSNRNLFMICPFHKDTHPSVSMTRKSGKWVCGKCKLGGDFNRFLELYSERNPEAKVDQIDRSSEAFIGTAFDEEDESPQDVDIEEAKRLIRLCYDYYAEDYLSSRNIPQSLAEKLQLGYNPDNRRVIIPAFSFDGEFLGVTGRSVINERPKYVHTIFTKHIPFHSYYRGSDFTDAKYEAKQPRVVLVEGSFDAFRLLQFLSSENKPQFMTDIDGVVVVYGSNMTDNLCQYLGTKRTRFIVCFDDDEAGKKGELKAAERLLNYGLVWTVGNKPKGKDIGDYMDEEFQKLILEAYPF